MYTRVVWSRGSVLCSMMELRDWRMNVAYHDAMWWCCLIYPISSDIFYDRTLEEATAAAGFNYLRGYTEGGPDSVVCGGPVHAWPPLILPRECILSPFPLPKDFRVLWRYTTFTTSSHPLFISLFPPSLRTTTHSSHCSLLCIVTPLTTLSGG